MMEIQGALDAFMRSRELRCSPKGLESYRYEVPTFVRYLLSQDVKDTAEITPALVEGYLGECRDRGVNNNTLRAYRARVAAFVNWLGENDHCREGIMRRVYKPRASQHIRKTYSEDEVRALLEYARLQPMPYWATFDVAVLLLLMDTGIRVSELCGLDMEDLQEGGRVKVLGKGQKERFVAVSPATASAMASYLKFRGLLRPTDPVFVSVLGSRVTQHGLYQRMRRLGQRIGVETHPHKFRHTFALMAVKNGANPKALQLFLGHSKLATTDEYLQAFGNQDAINDHEKFSPVRAMFQH